MTDYAAEQAEAAALGLPWVYLGYWIRSCRKMSYKHEYAPLEFYLNGEWTRDADPA